MWCRLRNILYVHTHASHWIDSFVGITLPSKIPLGNGNPERLQFMPALAASRLREYNIHSISGSSTFAQKP